MSASSRPWHERVPLLSGARGWLRERYLDALVSGLSTEQGSAAARRALLGRPLRGAGGGLDPGDPAAEYPELPPQPQESGTCARADIVFITARFRSGSTLLWNLFRNVGGCTAYYEPFNERRWFDPRTRGEDTDPTHQHVDDYWKEYEGLGAGLARLYEPAFHDRDLYLPEDAWWPGMKRYLEALVEGAHGRPVLQFNRLDFRLPWVRREFPNAAIVHIYRHPRDQWCSTLLRRASFGKGDPTAAFADHDHFYLRLWAADLKRHFPFLDVRKVEHPYQLSYYIWKLSYLFGRRWATHSLSFESLVDRSEETLGKLLGQLGLSGAGAGELARLVEPPALGRWKDWASDAWFKRHEQECERVLRDFLHRG